MNAPTNLERTASRRRSGKSLLAMLLNFGFIVGVVAVITVPVQSQTSSPSGSKIAFERTSDSGNTWDIYVMNADGSGLTQLTTPGGYERNPAWSPDGSKIAYDSYHPLPSGNSDIYVMNADGSNKTNLTNTPGMGDGVQELNPDWSPDGSKIVFQRIPDGVDTRDIYVMNPDGSGLTQLTTEGEETAPAWSPDGSKIAYVSYHPLPSGNSDIYVMNADGSNKTNLTNTPGMGDGVQELNPDWSPDGSKIVFERTSDSGNTSDIYVMNADGSGVTQLTTPGGDERRPVWSPDGSKIAFSSRRDGNAEIYVMNADGSGQTNLTNTPGGVHEGAPDWGVSAAAPPDTTPPGVESTAPGANATGVAPTTNVAATFPEEVQNVTPATFKLERVIGKQGVEKFQLVAATVTTTPDGMTATLDPNKNLQKATYQATLTDGVTDAAGNALADAPYTWRFTVGR